MKILWIISVCFLSVSVQAANVSFWDKTRRGTNCFNLKEDVNRIKAADKVGLEIIRMSFTKWKSATGKQGAFLIGSTDQYQGINEKDFSELLALLDAIKDLKIKMVLVPLALPGAQWRQYNKNKNDIRIWSDSSFQESAINFWKDLAKRLKGNPAIAGLNLINEPMPEFGKVRFEDWSRDDIGAWCKKVENTPQDLNVFYSKAIAAIREVDQNVPIIIDSGFYANAWMIQCLKKQQDANVLYSFHMYEPYLFSNHENTKKYKYPGSIPWGERGPLPVKNWNKDEVERFFAPVDLWAKNNSIPANRIYVAEFGVNRNAPGAVEYFQDVLSLLQQKKWHWGFYSFRENEFPAMDYELGPKASLPAEYWDAEERGEFPSREKWYRKNPMWTSVLDALRGL